VNWKFLGYIVLALIVIQIPVVGPFFRIANTLIHESCHALMSLLLQGQVLQIKLFANTEGVTYITYSTRTAAILTSLAGYVGSSVTAYLLALLCVKKRHDLLLWLFVIVATVNVALWVRNPFGIVWLVLFIGLLLFALWWKKGWPSFLAIGLFVFMLAESISSSYAILWLSLHTPAAAGDAANLAEATGLHAGVWGILFMLQASVLGYLSLRAVLRMRRG